MNNMKKILTFVLIAFISMVYFVGASAAITGLKVPVFVRLNESLTIIGNYGVPDTWCKFEIRDENGFAIERLPDQLTFADGNFYATKQITEPPYYRGDDYNAIVVCGSDSAQASFSVEQPLSLAHPIQKWWEFGFSEANRDSLLLVVSFIILLIFSVLIIVWFAKRGYNA